MKKYFVFFLLYAATVQAQQLAPLTVQKIMRDPKWMGTAPSNYRWAEDSKTVFFTWNPENKDKDQNYKVSVLTNKPQTAEEKEADKAVGNTYSYNKDKTLGLAEKGGDVYIYTFKTKKEQRLTNTVDRESGAKFLYNNDVVFQRNENIFQLNLATNELKQLTNFIKGKRPNVSEKVTPTLQDTWLKTDQTALFDIIKKRNQSGNRPQMGPRRFGFGNADDNQRSIKATYLDDKFLSGLMVSPTGRFVSYRLSSPVTTNHNTVVPNYVTASGYTEDIPGRTKVGETLTTSESFVYDSEKDSVYQINTSQIPGIKDLPDYLKDYPKQLTERKAKNEDRKVNLGALIWNETGTTAILTASAQDNKDLWILKLDAATGSLNLLERQRDEAWIGGPGVGRNIEWIDNNRFYFQSEATGYSHLYVFNVTTGDKKQLTSGKWEVQKIQLSKDKSTFFISANKEHPGITHFYKLSVNGGELVQITNMKGGNEITLSPDEKWLAINYSYMNKPWELYIQPNKPGAKAVQITKSTTTEFDSYSWRQPDLVSFKNRYGDDVYAQGLSRSKPTP